jgi:hypothetical protein
MSRGAWDRTKSFACRASAAGRAENENGCTLECDGREAFWMVSGLKPTRRVGSALRNVRVVHTNRFYRSCKCEVETAAEGAGVEPGRVIPASRFSKPVSAPRRPHLPCDAPPAGFEPARRASETRVTSACRGSFEHRARFELASSRFAGACLAVRLPMHGIASRRDRHARSSRAQSWSSSPVQYR